MESHLRSQHRPGVIVCLGVLVLGAAATPALSVAPACKPCAGLTSGAGHDIVAALGQAPRLDRDARLFVRRRHDALAPWDGSAETAIAAAGGTPWVQVVFHTAAPLVQHAPELERELAGLAAIVHAAGPVQHFEIAWEPQVASAVEAAPPDRIVDYAFLLKRAAVVVTGGSPQARVLTGPLHADVEELRALYQQDVAAYLEGVVLQDPEDLPALQRALAVLEELDPGRPVSLVGLRWPAIDEATVAAAARFAAAGIAISFFDLPAQTPSLAPLAVLANETHGDLSYDPTSSPREGAALAFVRAKDLGLRVVTERQGEAPMALRWSDPTLTAPEVVNLRTGAATAIPGATGAQGVSVRIAAPVALLRLGRREAPDLGTVRGSAEVSTERQMPVEEILRRLQAFEDAQTRRLGHYQAINSTHLRFQGAGEQALEVTFRGPFFYTEGKGFDWAWRDLFINGVKWRGKELPEIPLIQPEKAAALPLQIHFTPEYRYRLRGTDTVAGRPVWVVDFEPADGQGAASGKLWQGTVWIDREHYGRVRTRALQVGLTGEVISNEETLEYMPLDAAGKATSWTAGATWLPLHVIGQQILSVVNSTTVVERETMLTDVVLNGADFDQQRAEVERSESTMVRDTDRGLRYLVKQAGAPERVVKEGFATSKLFMVGGLFYDKANSSYPLPLAGINYFTFDLKHTGQQANVFFAGALLQANIAQPQFRGSHFDVGGDAFALAIAGTNEIWRQGQKATAETVKTRTSNVGLHVGRPLGSFFRLGLNYRLAYFHYGSTSDTAHDFAVPSSDFLHTVELEGRYARAGYRFTLAGSWNERSRWERWGLPGAPFDPATKSFEQWDARFAKSWYLPRFQRLGFEADYLGGRDLDRFSKYGFGFFGASRVHGYSSSRVRAESAYATHLSYGIGVGEVVRLDLVGDAAWATDRESGLQRELLAGIGIAGSFMGPWQTIVQIDLGTPLAGPDHGFVAYLVFLKLFK